MTTQTLYGRRVHQTMDTLPKCNTCGAPATHGTQDNKEVPSNDEWRSFVQLKEKRGCAKHPVVSLTFYLDGRTLKTDDCKPERYRGEQNDAN